MSEVPLYFTHSSMHFTPSFYCTAPFHTCTPPSTLATTPHTCGTYQHPSIHTCPFRKRPPPHIASIRTSPDSRKSGSKSGTELGNSPKCGTQRAFLPSLLVTVRGTSDTGKVISTSKYRTGIPRLQGNAPPPPKDRHRAIGMGLVQGPRVGRLCMSEVPL